MLTATLCVALLFIVAIFGAHYQNGNIPGGGKKTVSESSANIELEGSDAQNVIGETAGDNVNSNDNNESYQGQENGGSGNKKTGGNAGEGVPLQISYNVDSAENGVMIMVETNLPDGVELSAEITNIDAVKKDIGMTDNSQPDNDKYSMLIERTFNEKAKDFVKNGRAYFKFPKTPKGELSLTVTMPVLKLQSASVKKILGEKGEYLTGDYVVYLSEFDDKTIFYNSSFVLE